jgi:hypothetical protein
VTSTPALPAGPPLPADNDLHHELTPEQASRLAVTALAADIAYWAHATAVDGRVAVDDLTRTLDIVRQASVPQV